MNNNITEDYCSFEVSKLLKEKGFAVGSSHSFNPTTNEPQNIPSLNSILPAIERPTHALAIKWIRENFGIYIQYRVGFGDTVWYDYLIQWNNGNEYYTGKTNEYFNSPEQAVEAALLYTLKNLIP